MALLAAHVYVTAVFVARVRVVVVFQIVIIVVSVCLFELHLGVNTVLNLFQEVQDVLLLAEVPSDALNEFNARLFMEHRDDYISMEVFSTSITISFSRGTQLCPLSRVGRAS